MNYTNKTISILAAFLIGLVSCGEEEVLNNNSLSRVYRFQPTVESSVQYSNISVEPKGFIGQNGSDEILTFQDMEDFIATLTELERQVQDLDDAFVEFYKDLDEEALNAKEEEIEFNEEKPLLDFANQIGFNSLYQKIYTDERAWLSQDDPDWNNDPDNYFIDNEALRVLLNEDSEVKIGMSIYKFNEDGSYYEITDGNLIKLDQIDNREGDINIIIHNNQQSIEECKTNKSNFDYIVSSSGLHRIKWVIKVYNYPWGCGIKSKVKSYKRRGRSWRKHRTYLGIGLEGRMCLANDSLGASTGWFYYSKEGKKKLSLKNTGSCQTKTNQVHGYHYGNGLVYNSTLRWFDL